jgi:hypothetical protein
VDISRPKSGPDRNFFLLCLCQPKEVAHFVPVVPPTARANSVNDVYVDENRIVYAVDRLKGGLYILELTI